MRALGRFIGKVGHYIFYMLFVITSIVCGCVCLGDVGFLIGTAFGLIMASWWERKEEVSE